jgi:hypothetical protein
LSNWASMTSWIDDTSSNAMELIPESYRRTPTTTPTQAGAQGISPPVIHNPEFIHR